MKKRLTGIALIMVMNIAQAQFYDPMKPPAYALRKMKLEKQKLNPAPPSTAATKSAAAPWVLSSILFSANRQSAIINDQLVKRGDNIKGARVIEVEKDRVRLNKKGKIIMLKLDTGSAIRVKSKSKSLREKKL